jgi:hypothetical protein
MGGIRISLKVELLTVLDLLPVSVHRTIVWRGGRREFEALRAELKAAMDAASRARGRSPIDYVGRHRLSELLYAVAASASRDETTQDTAARWLVAWVLSQPVPEYGGIYADHLDKDWLFNFADQGETVNMVAAPLPQAGIPARGAPATLDAD